MQHEFSKSEVFWFGVAYVDRASEAISYDYKCSPIIIYPNLLVLIRCAQLQRGGIIHLQSANLGALNHSPLVGASLAEPLSRPDDILDFSLDIWFSILSHLLGSSIGSDCLILCIRNCSHCMSPLVSGTHHRSSITASLSRYGTRCRHCTDRQ